MEKRNLSKLSAIIPLLIRFPNQCASPWLRQRSSGFLPYWLLCCFTLSLSEPLSQEGTTIRRMPVVNYGIPVFLKAARSVLASGKRGRLTAATASSLTDCQMFNVFHMTELSHCMSLSYCIHIVYPNMSMDASCSHFENNGVKHIPFNYFLSFPDLLQMSFSVSSTLHSMYITECVVSLRFIVE